MTKHRRTNMTAATAPPPTSPEKEKEQEFRRRGRITAVRKKNLAPILVGELKRATEVTVIQPEQLDQLKIDHQYQRPENRPMVNELIAVLEAGGTVPDPITVSVRPDGGRWIVDGQQRWAAHYLCQKPLTAVLFHVANLDEERRLFSVLNSNVRPTPNVRLKAWTGPSTAVMLYLQESPESPVRQEVTYSTGGKTRFNAIVLARGITAALSGVEPGGKTEMLLRTFDRLVQHSPMRAKAVARMLTMLGRKIFEAQSFPTKGFIALGLAAYERWNGTGKPQAPPMPSEKVIYNLKRLNWQQFASPGGLRWVQVLKGEILRRWPAI